LASRAPTDVCHIAETIGNLKTHIGDRSEALGYSGPQSVYNLNFDGGLELNSHHCDAIDQRPAFMHKMMGFPATEVMVNVVTAGIRYLLNKTGAHKMLSSRETPYALRIIGSRLLKKTSLYGLLKEVNAALHAPYEYQRHQFWQQMPLLNTTSPMLPLFTMMTLWCLPTGIARSINTCWLRIWLERASTSNRTCRLQPILCCCNASNSSCRWIR